MFRIKICGITRIEDGLAAARAGADAVGLNFYPPSPRCISLEQARLICAALPPAISKIGLFVNHSVQEVLQAYDSLGLDFIQLHGDETMTHIAQLSRCPTILAVRCCGRDLEPIHQILDQCQDLGCPPVAVLIDSHVPGLYGGTGQTADWLAVAQWWKTRTSGKLVLAGGLNPENVAQAIRTVRPSAVDTASGVESSPGIKDHQRIQQFVQQARAAAP